MKITVLFSGGVDSSVALALLKNQGYDPTAFYLKIWLEEDAAFLGTCPWDEDLTYVRTVCEQLQVPLEIISLQREYWDYVIAYTIAEIKAGRTPNPDIMCNKRVKFGAFLAKMGDSFLNIASGHYAITGKDEKGKPALFCSPDPIKDQTYFLAHMQREQFAHLLFPIGNLTKEQVRLKAAEHNLFSKDRKDSQGLCFLGKLKFRDFIKHHVGEQLGIIAEQESGRVLGEHKGFWFHTIGQRQGLGLAGGPWYVTHKDIENNVVFVSREYYGISKKRNTFTIDTCNWLAEKPQSNETLEVKLRHGPHRFLCTVEQIDGGMRVHLTADDQGIAPGQFAVFYNNNRCLGSGIINGW